MKFPKTGATSEGPKRGVDSGTESEAQLLSTGFPAPERVLAKAVGFVGFVPTCLEHGYFELRFLSVKVDLGSLVVSPRGFRERDG